MPNWHHNPMKWKCLANKGPPSPNDDRRQILAERCHTTSFNAMHHKCYHYSRHPMTSDPAWNASDICWSVMLVTNISSTIVTRHSHIDTFHFEMWHNFHCRNVTYFSLPWCDILFTAMMWHTFHYRDVTYQLPWCDILFTTVMWHTFNYRDVTYFQLPWCDTLSIVVMWHTFH